MIRDRLLPVAACSILFLCTGHCFAQRYGTTRTPGYNQRATISPYVNLFNNNQGGVNNYFTLVRPLQRQQQFNQQQQIQTRNLQRQLAQPYGGGVSTGAIPIGAAGQGMLRQALPGVGQPATAASYFNYSHFYSTPLVGQRR